MRKLTADEIEQSRKTVADCDEWVRAAEELLAAGQLSAHQVEKFPAARRCVMGIRTIAVARVESGLDVKSDFAKGATN